MFVLPFLILVSKFEMFVLPTPIPLFKLLHVCSKSILNLFNSFEKSDCEMFAYKNCMIIENKLFIQAYIMYYILL